MNKLEKVVTLLSHKVDSLTDSTLNKLEDIEKW